MRPGLKPLIIVAAFLMNAVPTVGQAQVPSLPREVLLQKARAGFDSYMLGEFEAASLARIQKAVFPDNWHRLREKFANTAADRMQGKVTREQAQQRYLVMIQQSFAEVDDTIRGDSIALSRAPLAQLVAWESAFGEQLARHIAADPDSCTLAKVLQKPATPADTIAKLDLIGAFWSAYGQGKAAPVHRPIQELSQVDVEKLRTAIAASNMPAGDRELVSSDGKLADTSRLGCGARLRFSKAILSLDDDTKERVIAHIITRASPE